MSLERFARRLPAIPWDAYVSLGEGSTPLVKSAWIGPRLGLERLYFKMEMCNPSGSYKDRFIACELAIHRSLGRRVCLATSSGNTGSSLAAYAARLGMKCVIMVLESTPDGKLMQMAAHGASIYRVRRFGAGAQATRDVMERLQALAATRSAALVISAFKFCPDGMCGVKTISYEIHEALGDEVAHVFAPVGGGGLMSATAMGFLDLHAEGARLPRVHAVQPALNDTVVSPLREGAQAARPVSTRTAISGLGVQTDIDGTRAMELVRATGGTGVLASDEEILETQRELLEREGIFVEPAGAASVAGLKRAVEEGVVTPGETAVCLLTGHGFKDLSPFTDAVKRISTISPEEITAALV